MTLLATLTLATPAAADVRVSSATYDSRCAQAWKAVRYYRDKTAQHRQELGASSLPPVEQNASCRRLRERAVYWRNTARATRLALEKWRRDEYADPPQPYLSIAICETGGINGGRPLWTHHNSVYSGAYGFAHSTWEQFKYPGYPSPAARATPRQQTRVAMRLVARFGGYSSWPACHRRLGLPG